MNRALLRAAAAAARILPQPVKRAIYGFKPLAGLLRAALNRSAPVGLAEETVAAGALQGLTLLLDMQIEKDYWLGTYEPELQAAAGELAQPGMTIYDVGANIGYVSLMLAQAAGPNGRVIAFEALPENAARLRRNLALNPALGARVTLVEKAVTGQVGNVRFLVHASGGMGKAEGSAGREAQYQNAIIVEGVSLDAFVFEQGNPPPQLIKMDIEGGEVMAVPGMRRLLETARPLLLMELHGQQSARVTWETLTGLGYTIRQMQPGYPVVPALDALGWKSYLVARYEH